MFVYNFVSEGKTQATDVLCWLSNKRRLQNIRHNFVLFIAIDPTNLERYIETLQRIANFSTNTILNKFPKNLDENAQKDEGKLSMGKE